MTRFILASAVAMTCFGASFARAGVCEDLETQIDSLEKKIGDLKCSDSETPSADCEKLGTDMEKLIQNSEANKCAPEEGSSQMW